MDLLQVDRMTIVMRVNEGSARAFGLSLAALLLLAAGAKAGAGDDARMADYFGFLPLEVYKLDTRISGLLIRDLDGEGLARTLDPEAWSTLRPVAKPRPKGRE